jgi:hypothetical protein
MCYNLNSGLWTGSQYQNPENPFRRVLVIGHSTFGTPPDDPLNIKAWIANAITAEDRTFDRFFKVVKGLVARQVSRQERALFFNRIAFNNFVSKILERNRNPTSEEYKEAKTELPGVIAEANPRAIFAFGFAHRRYSEPVIQEAVSRTSSAYTPFTIRKTVSHKLGINSNKRLTT